MLRARENSEKLSENDVKINATIRPFSLKFMRFRNAIGMLQNPRCKERHEDCLKIIAEDIIAVRKHFYTCRLFMADSEAMAEILNEHIAYVEMLVDKASRLLEEQPHSPEEKVALRFGYLWEKGGHRRVYFDKKLVAEAVGFEVRVRGTTRYLIGGAEYTYSAMAELFQAFDGTYYDLAKNAFVSASSKNDLLDIFKVVFSREVEAMAVPEELYKEAPGKEVQKA